MSSGRPSLIGVATVRHQDQCDAITAAAALDDVVITKRSLFDTHCGILCGMSEMTTIKVPKALRDSVMSSARAEGLTAAEFLKLLTQEHARNQRFAAVRQAYATARHDPDYEEITEDWNEATADGLADA